MLNIWSVSPFHSTGLQDAHHLLHMCCISAAKPTLFVRDEAKFNTLNWQTKQEVNTGSPRRKSRRAPASVMSQSCAQQRKFLDSTVTGLNVEILRV